MSTNMNENGFESRRDRLEGLLPFFLNGSLSGEELREVEEWLATDPAAAVALEEAEAEYSATAAANEAIRPPTDALARFSRALEREAGPEYAAVPSLVERVRGWFTAVPVQAAWVTAAIAVALLVGQTAWMGVSERADYEVAGVEESARAPFVLVTFAGDASMTDITTALEEGGLVIDEGPMPGGMYRVIVPAETSAEYDALVAELEQAPFVDILVAGRKPADEK